jgi:hypothetical protein
LGKILQNIRTWFPTLDMKGYDYEAIGKNFKRFDISIIEKWYLH